MKLTDIIKVLSTELGTSDLKEITKSLKSESAPKFRITGKAIGHFGFTGKIKNVSEEGVKVFNNNGVSLIRLEDIEGFDKAKPRVERPVRPAKKAVTSEPAKPAQKKAVTPEPAKPVAKKAKASVKPVFDFDDDDDFDDEDDFDFEDEDQDVKKVKRHKKVVGKNGSKFIPAFKK